MSEECTHTTDAVMCQCTRDLIHLLRAKLKEVEVEKDVVKGQLRAQQDHTVTAVKRYRDVLNKVLSEFGCSGHDQSDWFKQVQEVLRVSGE